MIDRHFVRVGDRRVHYRTAGSGPPLLLVHQSPRSSAEYEPVMRQWSQRFTCIAPDSPGFGQSDPLPDTPEVEDFADATVAFMDAVGLERTAAYGFHSGAIILVTAAKRHPARFAALAAGGYAVWTPAEQALFSQAYLPPFVPQPYGEHLTWLWARILEQSWFFPWFDARPETRLSRPTDDPVAVDAVVREMLASGDAYRAGYGAVIRANRDVPADASGPPVLIAAYDGDPLQAHIDRLGELPANWRTAKVREPVDLEDAALAHVASIEQPPCPPLAQADDEGFVRVAGGGFDGLVHWRGRRGAERLVLHAPGRSVETLDTGDALAIDLPGHGLSDAWDAEPDAIDAWVEVVAAAVATLGAPPTTVVGYGASFLLALAVAEHLGAEAAGEEVHLPAPDLAERYAAEALPDLTPDRHGAYLQRAWNMVRARRFFWPWFAAAAANATPFDPADLAPERLAVEHREAIRARSGRALLRLLLRTNPVVALRQGPRVAHLAMAHWARSRADIWQPPVTVEGRN